ncbi:hypothetical protein N7G274_001014 [Stereocaulon virgatum]|uniref:Uncharacterized protein n=1 Tax=Stereocaulon virgatum TaxID=373712 RepID=A0ABR4AQD8_9LECA
MPQQDSGVFDALGAKHSSYKASKASSKHPRMRSLAMGPLLDSNKLKAKSGFPTSTPANIPSNFNYLSDGSPSNTTISNRCCPFPFTLSLYIIGPRQNRSNRTGTLPLHCSEPNQPLLTLRHPYPKMAYTNLLYNKTTIPSPPFTHTPPKAHRYPSATPTSPQTPSQPRQIPNSS